MINNRKYLLIGQPVYVYHFVESASNILVFLNLNNAGKPNGNSIDNFILTGHSELPVAQNERQLLYCQGLYGVGEILLSQFLLRA